MRRTSIAGLIPLLPLLVTAKQPPTPFSIVPNRASATRSRRHPRSDAVVHPETGVCVQHHHRDQCRRSAGRYRQNPHQRQPDVGLAAARRYRNVPCDMAGAFRGHPYDGRQFHVPGRSVSGGQAMDWFGAGIDGPLIVVRGDPFRRHSDDGGKLDFPGVVAEACFARGAVAEKLLVGKRARAWPGSRWPSRRRPG